MTRNEEIIIACKSFLSAYSNKDQVELFISFLKGAFWADEHPIDMWHDVSDEPNHNQLLLGIDSEGVSIYKWCMQEDNWKTFISNFGLKKWAYINDLLPKGGSK